MDNWACWSCVLVRDRESGVDGENGSTSPNEYARECLFPCPCLVTESKSESADIEEEEEGEETETKDDLDLVKFKL